MLDTLDDIPWATLEHAYGSAADVPDQIRALRSPAAEDRKNALWHLYGNVFHQGSRYPASPYAVPFLLELLADPSTADRVEILHLLASLALGYDEAWLPNGFPISEYRRDIAEAKFDRYIAEELDTYDAVRAGLPVFRTLLTDDDPGLRTGAAYLLGWFSEDAAGSVPALTTALSDAVPGVAATALVSLGLLAGDFPAAKKDTVTAAEAALSDSRDILRWAGAVVLARLQSAGMDTRVRAELRTWSASSVDEHLDVPFLGGDLAEYANQALDEADNKP